MNKNQVIAVLAVIVIVVAGIIVVVAQQSNNNEKKTEVTVTQSDGTEKTVPYQPQKIICLSTYTCEFLEMYGYADKVVGVPDTVITHPDLAQYYGDCTSVGSFSNPNMETVVALDSDLIIIYASSTSLAASLDNLGLTYILLECSNIDTMTTQATSLGEIVGNEKMADKYCDYFTSIVDKIDTLVAKQTSKSTVYMESYSGYSAAGSSSAYYQLAVRAGADMVYKQTVGATVAADWIIEQQPEIIIKTPTLSNMVNGGSANIYNEVVNRTGFNTIPAVENGDVYILCSQLFSGPRCFAGLVACFNDFYPNQSGYILSDLLEDYNEIFGLNMSISSMYYPN